MVLRACDDVPRGIVSFRYVCSLARSFAGLRTERGTFPRNAPPTPLFGHKLLFPLEKERLTRRQRARCSALPKTEFTTFSQALHEARN